MSRNQPKSTDPTKLLSKQMSSCTANILTVWPMQADGVPPLKSVLFLLHSLLEGPSPGAGPLVKISVDGEVV